jgi:hypothetical protein
LAVLVFLLFHDAVRGGLPAPARFNRGGDQVAIVLHRVEPVIHQVLVNIVPVDQGAALVGGEQGFADRVDDVLRMEAGLQRFQDGGGVVFPVAEHPVHIGHVSGKFGVREDGWLDVVLADFQAQIIRAAFRLGE